MEVSTIEENDGIDVVSSLKKSIKQHNIDQLAASLSEEQLLEEKEYGVNFLLLLRLDICILFQS